MLIRTQSKGSTLIAAITTQSGDVGIDEKEMAQKKNIKSGRSIFSLVKGLKKKIKVMSRETNSQEPFEK